MIGIIGAMEEEIQVFRNSINQQDIKTIGPFKFYTGTIAEQKVTVLQCGIGKVHAAIGCTVLIENFHPQFVINTGSAGGIHPDLRVGDIVLSQALVYHDVDVTPFGYAPGQVPGQPERFRGSQQLLNQAEQAIKELQQTGIFSADIRYLLGTIASGDTFMHEPEKIADIRRRFPEVAAVEMEGTAIAHTCTVFTVPCLVIRTISDVAGTESPYTSEEFLPLAAQRSGAIVQQILKDL